MEINSIFHMENKIWNLHNEIIGTYNCEHYQLVYLFVVVKNFHMNGDIKSGVKWKNGSRV